MEDLDADSADNPNLMYARMVDSFTAAAEAVLPRKALTPNKPWITSRTTDLISDRHTARVAGNLFEERRLAKLVKSSVAAGRSDWLNDLVSTGGWDAIRRLRKGFVKHQGRLRNTSGNLVLIHSASIYRTFSGQCALPHCCHQSLHFLNNCL